MRVKFSTFNFEVNLKIFLPFISLCGILNWLFSVKKSSFVCCYQSFLVYKIYYKLCYETERIIRFILFEKASVFEILFKLLLIQYSSRASYKCERKKDLLKLKGCCEFCKIQHRMYTRDSNPLKFEKKTNIFFSLAQLWHL